MHQSCYSIDFFISIFQACAPRYVYYIFMDRMDPVGVCYSARNACSEKRPQIRHHRPCVESGKAMRSKTKISFPRCANVYFFLFPPFSNPHVCQLSVSLVLCINHLSNHPRIQACAPRYLWFSRNFKRREPVGSCYTAQNEFKDIQTHSPCRTSKFVPRKSVLEAIITLIKDLLLKFF